MTLVNITSDEQDNPYLIFEILNNKGQELTQADLVRNYIFMQLPNNKQEEIYQQQWQPLQQQFKTYGNKQEYSAEMTKAFLFYLRKDGESVSEKAVYKTLKDKFNKSGEIEENLEELIKFVKYYQYFNFDHPDCPIQFKKRFKRLLRLDFKACQMFLLNVYHEYEQEYLSEKDFDKILIYLESYFVRRWFAEISTKSLSNVLNQLYSLVKKENKSSTLDGLHTLLSSYEGTKVWPDDEIFRQGIINKIVYKSRSSTTLKQLKLVLESLEETLSKEKVDPTNLTIEHIMPQKLTKEWKDSLGKGSSTLHKKWLHTLGNLTLTGYNSELSNKSFELKLIELKQSNISLNKYFQNIEIWNEESIQKRAEYLAEIAIQVGPR
ncbi:MAG: HNH endonuclease family protein [Microcoleaceae cyanobacterium]